MMPQQLVPLQQQQQPFANGMNGNAVDAGNGVNGQFNPADPQNGQMLANGVPSSDQLQTTTTNNMITNTTNDLGQMTITPHLANNPFAPSAVATFDPNAPPAAVNGPSGSSSVDVEASTLNPEVQEFNPSGFGGSAVVQQTVQEQLFGQLQDCQKQMASFKHQIEQQLAPTLAQLQQNLAVYQMNQALLAHPQHNLTYQQLFLSIQAVTQQIQLCQSSYAQLEQNAATLRYQYQQNKPEELVVDDLVPTPPTQNDGGTDPMTIVLGQEQPQDAWGQQVQGVADSNPSPMTDTNPSGESMGDQDQAVPVHVVAVDRQPPQPQLVPLEAGVSHSDSQSVSAGPPSKADDDEVSATKENGLEFLDPHRSSGDRLYRSSTHSPQREEMEEDHAATNTNPSASSAFGMEEVRPMSKFRMVPKDGGKSRFNANPNSFGNSVSRSPLHSNSASHSEAASPSVPTTPQQQQQHLGAPPTRRYQPRRVGPDQLTPAQSFNSSHGSYRGSPSTFNESESEAEDENEDGITTAPRGPEGDEIRYSVSTLLEHRKDYLMIKWSEHDIPQRVRMFFNGVNNEKYMEDVDAMFRRRAAPGEAWVPDIVKTVVEKKTKKERLFKKLTGVLNKMTPDKFDRIAKQSMDIVNEFAATEPEMNLILALILKFGIKQPAFCNQYAKLCNHLHDHLHKLAMISDYDWIAKDEDISGTFRRMVITQTNDLFTTLKEHSPAEEPTMTDGSDGKEPRKLSMDPEDVELRKAKRKDAFFAVMVLVAALYNVDLIKKTLVYKGVLKMFLPKEAVTLTAIDMEGVCRLFKCCGKKLDKESSNYVDRFIKRLDVQAKKFDFRTQVLVDDVKEMRANRWEERIKKEVAKTTAEVARDHEKEQAAQYGRNRGGGGRRHGGDDSSYRRKDSRGKPGRRYPNERSYDGDDYYYDDDDYYYKEKGNGRYKEKGRGGRGGYADSNGRYKVKSPDKDSATAKQFGIYQKKTVGKTRRIVGRPNDSGKGSSTLHSLSSLSSSGGGGGGGSGFSDGHKNLSRKLARYVKEYCGHGDNGDILDLNCADLKVWRVVLNDSFRDSRQRDIELLIKLVVDCFMDRLFNGPTFQESVLKYLAMNLDDSAVDQGGMYRYMGQLLAHLCWNECVNDKVFLYFFKTYKEYSEVAEGKKKKRSKTVHEAALSELKQLGAEHDFVRRIQKMSPEAASASGKYRHGRR